MRCALIVTNYNNSKYTLSLFDSLTKTIGNHEWILIVVDNASNKNDLDILKNLTSKQKSLYIIENSFNSGYFRGLNLGLAFLYGLNYEFDYIVIGNNDLIFPEDFFNKLEINNQKNYNKIVICPDIITIDGIHQNPHVLTRISKIRIILWDTYYLNYTFSTLILFLYNIFKPYLIRKDNEFWKQEGEIAEGYGACFLLTKRFANELKFLWSPTFLMGEEFFLKKQLNQKGYLYYYDPNITVIHHDHATTGNVLSKKIWKICKESHKVFKEYYKKSNY